MHHLLARCALAASVLQLGGCGGGFVIGHVDCESEIASVISVHGSPDEVDRRTTQAGLHIQTFWYLRSGLAVTFTWGSDLSCHRQDQVFGVNAR